VSERDNLPLWRGRRGRYEVWFLTITDPERRAGYWIRHTIRAPISGPPEPRIWFAAFSLDDPASTFGLNEGFEPGALTLATDRFEVQMGDSVFASGRARGGIDGGDHRVRWDLHFPTGAPTLRLLPDFMYRGGLAPTKPYSPNPDTLASGHIEIDGERWALHDAPAQQGHIGGTRHAERWAWASCSDFGGDVAFHALSGQGRRGPFLTPFLTSVALRYDGDWIRLHGLSTRRDWGLGWWRFSVDGRRHRLEADVRADPKGMVRARYLDPDDTPRWCHNSEVASCRLTLWERRSGGWQDVAELESTGGAHAEWAGRTPAPGVEALHRELP
jgi:Tocopherol cyclase